MPSLGATGHGNLQKAKPLPTELGLLGGELRLQLQRLLALLAGALLKATPWASETPPRHRQTSADPAKDGLRGPILAP